MRSLAEVIRGADPTAAETATVEWVHEVVAGWAAGRLPLPQVRTLCRGRQRFDAMRFTPLDDPRRADLRRCIDELVATDATDEAGWWYATTHGLFSTADIRGADGAVAKRGDDIVIVFPGERGVIAR